MQNKLKHEPCHPILFERQSLTNIGHICDLFFLLTIFIMKKTNGIMKHKTYMILLLFEKKEYKEKQNGCSECGVVE